MKTKAEIEAMIEDERHRLRTERGHMASIIRGWLMALEWVLEERELKEGESS